MVSRSYERLLARLWELAQRAAESGRPQFFGFLTPAQRGEALRYKTLSQYCDVRFDGGYPEAERVFAVFVPFGWTGEPGKGGSASAPAAPVAALHAKPRGKGASLTHRDILGSLLALGIRREVVGDILPAKEGGFLVFVAADMAPFLLSNWDKAGWEALDISAGNAEQALPPTLSEISITVASPRLDAVLAEGFRFSRTQAAEAIRKGEVLVNWVPCEDADTRLAEGDTITLRHRGRLQILETGGQSRKGRTYLRLSTTEAR